MKSTLSTTLKTFSILFTFFFVVGIYAQNGTIELQTTTDQPSPKTVYGNSVPIAYGVVQSNGQLVTGYGVDSVTIGTFGQYTIVLKNNFIGSAAVSVTRRLPYHSAPENNITYSSSQNIVSVFIADTNSNPTTSSFSFVVYGMPLNTGSGCPSDTSGTGFAQAPNDFLRFNAVEDANCVIDIPFAFSDPAMVKVNVMGFVGGGTGTVEVEIDFNPLGGSPTTQTVNLTSAGMVLNLGQYISNNNVPYTTWLDLTYDGTQFVTARVRMDAL